MNRQQTKGRWHVCLWFSTVYQYLSVNPTWLGAATGYELYEVIRQRLPIRLETISVH
ncbi:MAG: hypothetical protein AAGA83_06340 [Cyanobacteria bacterium P01_F01_bin.116]